MTVEKQVALERNQSYLFKKVESGVLTNDNKFKLITGSKEKEDGQLLTYDLNTGYVEIINLTTYETKLKTKSTEKRGYITLQIYRGGEEYVCYVHQLASLIKHYIINRRDDGRCGIGLGGVGNHLNFDHTDNSINNIEYITEKENDWHGVVVNSIIRHRLLDTKSVIILDKNGNTKNTYKALTQGISWHDINDYCKTNRQFEVAMRSIKLKKDKEKQDIMDIVLVRGFVNWLRANNKIK